MPLKKFYSARVCRTDGKLFRQKLTDKKLTADKKGTVDLTKFKGKVAVQFAVKKG